MSFEPILPNTFIEIFPARVSARDVLDVGVFFLSPFLALVVLQQTVDEATFLRRRLPTSVHRSVNDVPE